MSARIIVGDCVEVMCGMDEASVDAIVTDPPYGLEFMGKEWDRLGGNRTSPTGIGDRATPWVSNQGWNRYRCANCGHLPHGGSPCTCGNQQLVSDDRMYRMQEWHHAWAVEALRVAKPGAHLLAFGGTRTYHRLACALEDAGWEIRDCIAWMYGSGFPKSLDVSKAIDKAAGAEREVVGRHIQSRQQRKPGVTYGGPGQLDWQHDLTAPATPDAERWQGWGTALKPAFEPIVVARKPLAERNVASQVLATGTGALNIDGTRIAMGDEYDPTKVQRQSADNPIYVGGAKPGDEIPTYNAAGRWPANVVLDEEAAAMLDEQTGELPTPATYKRGATVRNNVYGQYGSPDEMRGYGDTGGASRFFKTFAYEADTSDPRDIGGELEVYGAGEDATADLDATRFRYVPKADREERERGLEHLPTRSYATHGAQGQGPLPQQTPRERDIAARNTHPTVKPVALMQWLCRLVTPPGGTVLDPFTGSGSTGIAALREGFEFIGIEREPEYAEIAEARIVGDAPLFNVVETA